MSDPGSTVVVVGATGSLGSVVCRRMAARGMAVVAVARTAEALEALCAGTAGIIACPADISDSSATATIQAAVMAIGQPVRLALLAAGLPVKGSVETIDPDLMAVGAQVKLAGVLRLLHAVRDDMVVGSRFAAVAGTLGIEPGANEAGPGAINAGLINLMKQVSLNYGPKGITVHTLVPGPMDTPRLRRIATTIAEERAVTFDQVWAEYAAKTSLGRLPTIEEAAWAVELLLAPEADILHGSVLHLDAGGLRGAI